MAAQWMVQRVGAAAARTDEPTVADANNLAAADDNNPLSMLASLLLSVRAAGF